MIKKHELLIYSCLIAVNKLTKDMST